MMKRSAVLGMVFVAGCVAAEPTTESTTTSAITTSITTEAWDPSAKSADKTDALWPTSAHTTQILYRVGPDKFGNPAFLAFVVWNHTTVGHVYWIEIGSVGTDFKQSWDNAFASRTNTQPPLFDRYGGSTGGGGVGTPPMPHPNVSNFVISGAWLDQAKTAAGALDQADANFNQYAE